MPTVTCKCLNAVYKEAEAVIRKQAASVAAELSRLTGKEHAAGAPTMTEADDGRFRCEVVVGEVMRDVYGMVPYDFEWTENVEKVGPPDAAGNSVRTTETVKKTEVRHRNQIVGREPVPSVVNAPNPARLAALLAAFGPAGA